MRYILNDSGYIETVSFNGLVECNDKTCTEYTGTIPTDYENLAEWSENANINAYKIVEGNLVFDSDEDTRLQNLWTSQKQKTENTTSNSKILWTNPNPTATFNATTITLASGDYDILEFFMFKNGIGDTITSIRVLKGYDSTLSCATTMGAAGKQYNATLRRDLTRNSDTSYTIGENAFYYNAGAIYNDNNFFIPQMVVVHKMGLF